jgi:hypothetical protein
MPSVLADRLVPHFGNGHAAIALLAGMINLKDFWFYGRGVSFVDSGCRKAGYLCKDAAHSLQAENLAGALIGAVVLAILVQIVEFMCNLGGFRRRKGVGLINQRTGHDGA